MQRFLAAIVLAGSILRTDPVLVIRVNDGDSISVQSRGTVRLLGIEASSDRARDRLESLVIRRWVRLEYDDANASRRRAYLMLETGVCVNLTLVREGLARVAKGAFSRRAEFERAEAEAQRFRRGIWAGYTAVRP